MSAGVERFFVDTNVLLYSLDPADAVKRELAHAWLMALWNHNAGQLSWQVIHEFYSNAVRKLGIGIPRVRAEVESFVQWQPVGYGLGIVQRAWYWMDKAGLHYWDSLILASAETAGCAYLLSEDFQAGQRFGGITVVNPFRRKPEEFGLI